MYFAIQEGERVTPQPGLRNAVCAVCGGSVIARCGRLKLWHFVHADGRHCDEWSEPETDWQVAWKGAFPTAWCEVPLDNHAADVKTSDGRIIAFQQKALKRLDVLQRTVFFSQRGELLWVLKTTKVIWNRGPVQGALPCRYVWAKPRPEFADLAGRLWLHLSGDILVRLDRIDEAEKGLAWQGCGLAMNQADWLAAVLTGQPFPAIETGERSQPVPEGLVLPVSGPVQPLSPDSPSPEPRGYKPRRRFAGSRRMGGGPSTGQGYPEGVYPDIRIKPTPLHQRIQQKGGYQDA